MSENKIDDGGTAFPASSSAMMPLDPTEDMISAALKVDWECDGDESGAACNVWHAMAAAAPKSNAASGVEIDLDLIASRSTKEYMDWVEGGNTTAHLSKHAIEGLEVHIFFLLAAFQAKLEEVRS